MGGAASASTRLLRGLHLGYCADGPKSGRLTSPINLEYTSLVRRLNVCGFSLEASVDISGQFEHGDTRYCLRYVLYEMRYVRLPPKPPARLILLRAAIE
jgi:hypothetical protein